MKSRLFEYLQSFAVVALVLLAITGISYHLFRDDGWIEAIVGNLWGATIQYPLIVLPVIVAAIFLGKRWAAQRAAHGKAREVPDAFIYILVAAGLVFVGRWIAYGTL